MTRPDKCPECGADKNNGTHELGGYYTCGSFYSFYSETLARSYDCLSKKLGRKLTLEQYLDFEILDRLKESLNQPDIVLRDVI